MCIFEDLHYLAKLSMKKKSRNKSIFASKRISVIYYYMII